MNNPLRVVLGEWQNDPDLQTGDFDPGDIYSDPDASRRGCRSVAERCRCIHLEDVHAGDGDCRWIDSADSHAGCRNELDRLRCGAGSHGCLQRLWPRGVDRRVRLYDHARAEPRFAKHGCTISTRRTGVTANPAPLDRNSRADAGCTRAGSYRHGGRAHRELVRHERDWGHAHARAKGEQPRPDPSRAVD